MPKEQRISDFTADQAIGALEAKLPGLQNKLQAVEADLQAPEVLLVQEKMRLKDDLQREMQEINTAIGNIRRAKTQSIETGVGGGCAS